MSGYRYNDGGNQIFDYLYPGNADHAVAAVGTSDEGSLKEALVRAAEHARDVQRVPVGTRMVVTHLEIEIGSNPPISQYKVVLARPSG